MPTDPPPGLCGACRQSRLIGTRSGSRFWLCERSRTDPAFRRYPVVPVVRCTGFEPEAAGQAPPDRRA